MATLLLMFRADSPPPNFVGQNCGHHVGRPTSEGMLEADMPSLNRLDLQAYCIRDTRLRDVANDARSAPVLNRSQEPV